jgi:CheY-like chemotaxis protein
MIIRILIAEDEALIAQDLKATLVGRGCNVVSVLSMAEEAVRVVGELRPDVVSMDVHLAGKMDGIEAACRIREELSVPIIFITASADAATRKRAEAAKPFAWLIKPVSVDKLDQAIQRAVARLEGKKNARKEPVA